MMSHEHPSHFLCLVKSFAFHHKLHKLQQIENVPFKKTNWFNKYLSFVTGLTLGCGLVLFVVVLSEEFGSYRGGNNRALALPGSTVSAGPVHPEYAYGWSFVLAVAGFLAAEFSAVMCLNAFLNKFDSEVRSVQWTILSELEGIYPNCE